MTKKEKIVMAEPDFSKVFQSKVKEFTLEWEAQQPLGWENSTGTMENLGG